MTQQLHVAGLPQATPSFPFYPTTVDINIYPLSSTRLTSPYQLTYDTGTSPQSSDSQSAVRQEHSGWAVFIQQEAVYHQLITTYNHMYSYTMQLTKLI